MFMPHVHEAGVGAQLAQRKGIAQFGMVYQHTLNINLKDGLNLNQSVNF